MDLLYFLKLRLSFIGQLYDRATEPCLDVKTKIDAGDEPYVDRRDPEYATEPAFLEEWEEADNSVTVIGHWCLCWVQASLQAYLRECIGPSGGWWSHKRLRDALPKKEGKSSFERYRLLFLEDIGVDWNKGPIALSDLEQLNLTRDDLTHNIDMLSIGFISRNKKHAERFPEGLFVDELWRDAGLGLERLKVDREKLLLAVDLVGTFCAWLEAIRTRYPRYVKDLEGDRSCPE
jgi:hypothetical protein